jgi:ABC-type branched-subunit amino acid transport system ATPase component
VTGCSPSLSKVAEEWLARGRTQKLSPATETAGGVERLGDIVATGTSVLLVEQDVETALAYSDHA